MTFRSDLIELFLSNGADVTHRNNTGQNAREIALFYKQLELISYFDSCNI